MFQMRGPILYLLKLVLKISSKPILNAFYKDLRIVAILIEVSFEFFLRYNNIRPFIMSMTVFLLRPADADTNLEKRGYKWSAIVSISSSHIKMIITLLSKLIAIQM